MRIEQNPATNLQLGQVGQARSAAASEKSSEVSPPLKDGTSGHTPSAQLQYLREALKQIPDVRPDVVEQARQMLASGELLTPQAAEQTAAAILRSLD